MSKTIRHYIGGTGRNGKQDWRTCITVATGQLGSENTSATADCSV